MKKKRLVIGLFVLFICLLSLTVYTSFSGNIEQEEIIIKSMAPVYDETSGVVVNGKSVVFNDKNQVVKYNVVLENTQDYDVKISDIKLSTPTEEFLDYKIEGIEEGEVLSANSTKDLIVSFETMGTKGWGRNFADELTTNITFEKYVKLEEDKEEDKQPEAPAANTEELTSKVEKIEAVSIINNIIEFTEEIKIEEGQKIAVWIYSEPKFLGYFDVVVTNGVKQIVGLDEALKKVNVELGEHNIVLATEEGEAIGYVNIYIDEKQQVLKDNPQDTTVKEESDSIMKPSTDSNNEEENKVDNPYTSDYGIVMVLGIATLITGIAIVFLCNKKVAKYSMFIIMLSPIFSITNAEELIEVSINNNISFKSQNVMKYNGYDMYGIEVLPYNSVVDYWVYAPQIKNFYIENEIREIKEYAYYFDVSNDGNGRVMAYLVEKGDEYICKDLKSIEKPCYDLYLQADGIIYPNENAVFYFGNMINLEKIENLAGFDTSEVTNMSFMFAETEQLSSLDVSNFETSNVTDMRGMFQISGADTDSFTLDVSNFDTSKVTDMAYMFYQTGYSGTNFTLDVSNFDTSKVTDMTGMFNAAGYSNPNFVLDISNFDTSKVTSMNGMFLQTGYSNPSFTLDVSNFDTSNVKDMGYMFSNTGYNSKVFTLDLSGFDTSKVTDMSCMFCSTGYNNPDFSLDVSNFVTSNVTMMNNMFYQTGYSSTDFTLDVSNFDMSNTTYTFNMFYHTGYNSTKLNTSITISNPDFKDYTQMFYGAAVKEGSLIKVNYTSKTSSLIDKIVATKKAGANVVKGTCIDCGEDYVPMGTEIDINGEKFNVISQTDDTVTMLAQYTPGPKEIDIQKWSTNPKTYVNKYVIYLQGELEDTTLTGNLITVGQLKELGCTISDDYSGISGLDCDDSPYTTWLVNNQYWWTHSANSTSVRRVWFVYPDGRLGFSYFDAKSGVRPVITISKETLKGL